MERDKRKILSHVVSFLRSFKRNHVLRALAWKQNVKIFSVVICFRLIDVWDNSEKKSDMRFIALNVLRLK